MTAFLEITSRDPIVLRDGRPLVPGSRMKSVEWLYPSTVSGSLRTMVGKDLGTFEPAKLKAIEVAGAFPVKDNVLYLPTPKDCVLRSTPPAVFALQPRSEWRGLSNLPGGLVPLSLGDDVEDDFKPEKLPAFLGMPMLEAWLNDSRLEYPFQKHAPIIKSIEVEERMHVTLDSTRGAAAESLLFSSAGLVIPDGFTLQMRVRPNQTVRGVHPLGGERRIALWRSTNKEALGWKCPESIQSSIASAQRVRLVLATPALFDNGWCPGWLLREGPVPNTSVKLRLIGACVGRAKHISGWSLEKGQVGPKASRRMAPAGSVYLCDVISGSPEDLSACWLESVSDATQDQKDGFGLAIWGRGLAKE
jgi:CRISPR-associated protein Cmr3